MRVLTVCLAAMISAGLAAPAAGQDIRLTRPKPNVLELAGGAAGAEWHLRYGSSLPPPRVSADQPDIFRAAVYAAGPERAYFSHGGWLRLIDTQKGLVLGRWRFPCVITDVIARGERADVQMDCYEPPMPRLRVTRPFDPRAPELPPWPQSSLLAVRLPNLEAAPLLGDNARGAICSRAATPFTSSPSLIAEAEAATRRDPFSPSLGLALARLLRAQSGPAAAAAALEAAVKAGPGDFTEMFPLSSCLEGAGEVAAAKAAYDRGYADFLRRDYDPRLVTVLITRLILYGPPLLGPQRPGEDHRDELIDRIYRLAPDGEGAALAWRFHADDLDRLGRHDAADTWRARAADSESTGRYLSSPSRLRFLDRLFLVAQASAVAALALVVALFVKYLPQRRLVPPAPRGRFGVAPAAATLNVGFWSRRERLAFVLILLTGWLCTGVAAVYSRVTMLEMSAPIGPSMGTLGGLVYPRYLAERFAPSPERDLLTAMSDQANGDVARAEASYRALPQFAEAWNNLGVILRNSGREREAQDAFAHALRVDPSLGEAAWNASRATPTFFTTIHQQYVPDRPMVAPPSREQLARAYLGMSRWAVALRALGGPFANVVYLRRGLGRDVLGSSPGPLRTAVAIFELVGERNAAMPASILALAILMPIALIVFFVRGRDVTQPPGRAFRVLEYVLPGVSPYWRNAAAPVLLAWTLAVLFAWLQWVRETPYWLTRMMIIGLVRAYGADVPTNVVLAAAPRPVMVYAFIATLLLVNAIVVAWSSRRSIR